MPKSGDQKQPSVPDRWSFCPLCEQLLYYEVGDASGRPQTAASSVSNNTQRQRAAGEEGKKKEGAKKKAAPNAKSAQATQPAVAKHLIHFCRKCGYWEKIDNLAAHSIY